MDTTNKKLKIVDADFGRDIIFEEAFDSSEGREFLHLIHRLLGREMWLMNRNGEVIPIPRGSSVVFAPPIPVKDRFSFNPTIFKGVDDKDYIGIPIVYESDIFAMLILDAVAFGDQEISNKLKSVQSMIAWYIHVVHQRRMIGELHERTQTSSYDQLLLEHAKAIESANKYRKLTDTLKRAYLDTIYRLSITAEYKDRNTADHIKRMSFYSRLLAEKMGLKPDEVEMMLWASPMHDIGKMGVPDAVLLKQGPLEPAERAIMEKHPIFGANILGESISEVLEYGKIVALTHHERWDGAGYPQKLKGKEIPLAGRIAAVADVFDAMTTNRLYRQAWPFDDAMEMILKNKNNHFDPEIVEVFHSSSDQVRVIFDHYKDIAPLSYGV